MREHTKIRMLKQIEDTLKKAKYDINSSYGLHPKPGQLVTSITRATVYANLKVTHDVISAQPTEERLGAWHMPMRLHRMKMLRIQNDHTESKALEYFSTFKGRLWAASVVARSAARQMRRKSDSHLMKEKGFHL